MLTQERVREVFSYNADTGEVTLLLSLGNYKAGAKLGKDGKGYYQLQIDKYRTKIHRLIWLYVHGYMPKVIDHINGIRSDNRLCNLREATQRLNCQNRQHHRDGRLPGTSRIRGSTKWRAYYTIKGKQFHLGSYSTELEAHEVYVRKLKELGL